MLAYTGWRTLTLVSNPDEKAVFGTLVKRLPDFGDLPPSLGIGCLGMPGWAMLCVTGNTEEVTYSLLGNVCMRDMLSVKMLLWVTLYICWINGHHEIAVWSCNERVRKLVSATEIWSNCSLWLSRDWMLENYFHFWITQLLSKYMVQGHIITCLNIQHDFYCRTMFHLVLIYLLFLSLIPP